MEIEEEKKEVTTVPAIDTDKLFAVAPIVSEGPTQDDITKEILGGIKTEVENDNNIQSSTSSYIDYWEHLSEELSTPENKFEIPEEVKTGKNKEGKELTKKEQYNILVKTIQEHTDTGDDDFTIEYKKNKVLPEFNRDSWLEQQAKKTSILNKSSRDFLFESYKNYAKENKLEDKWTDEAINAHFDKMDPIELEKEGMKAKNVYTEFINKETSAQREKAIKQYTDNFNKNEQKNIEAVTTYLKSIENKNNLAGIPFDEVTKKEFANDLPNLIKRDIKTGTNKLEEILQSDEFFLELSPIIWLAYKGKLKDISADIINSTKEKIIDKLSTEPHVSSSSKNTVETVDANRLYGK
jgi:hypothetical protein